MNIKEIFRRIPRNKYHNHAFFEFQPKKDKRYFFMRKLEYSMGPYYITTKWLLLKFKF